MEITTGHLPLYLGVASAALVLAAILHLARDPLKHIPGPWYSRLTRMAPVVAGMQGKQVQWVESLHKQYGPVVRIAPDEVSFTSAAAFREIHRIGSGFLKAEMYDRLDASFGENPDVFTTRDPRHHAIRRRMYARPFSARFIRDRWQDRTDELVRFAMTRIRQDFERSGGQGGSGKQVDVAKWFRLMAADVAAMMSFGESSGNLQKGDKVPYLRAIDSVPLLGLLKDLFGRDLYRLIEAVPWPGALGRLIGAVDVMRDHGRIAVKNSKENSDDAKSIFSIALGQAKNTGDAKDTMTDEDMMYEAFTLITAGTETTASTLLSLTWSVLEQPELKRQLREEVTAVDNLDDETLEKLPILNAVIEETLRLHGPASGGLPRKVPHGGATLSETFVPQGTTVAVPAYIIHRDPELFPNPESFDHTRFLPSDPLAVTRRSTIAPFGGGSRICLGMHLAKMEIRKTIAYFFREFGEAQLAPCMHGRKQVDYSRTFGTLPAQPECFVTI